MIWNRTRCGAAFLLFTLAGAGTGFPATPAPVAGVAIVRTPGGVPGDAVREGAAEMLVLMQIARLQHTTGGAGLVAVGDRRGLFPAGAEDALQAAVLRGVPVVKLATGGRVLPAPHGLFLDGGSLSEAEAVAVLARCINVYGSLPTGAATGADGAVPPELREQLNRFQHEFTLAASIRLAAR